MNFFNLLNESSVSQSKERFQILENCFKKMDFFENYLSNESLPSSRVSFKKTKGN